MHLPHYRSIVGGKLGLPLLLISTESPLLAACVPFQNYLMIVISTNIGVVRYCQSNFCFDYLILSLEGLKISFLYLKTYN